MNRTEFATVLAMLAAGLQLTIADETAEVYYRALGDLTIESFRDAVLITLHVHEFRTLPTIAELRRRACEVTHGKPAGWDESLRRVRGLARGWGLNGWHKARLELLPLEEATIEALGGWRAICDSTNPQTLTAQYRDAYLAAAETQLNQWRLPTPLQQRLYGQRQARLTEVASGG